LTSGGNNFKDLSDNQLLKFYRIGMAAPYKFRIGMATALPAIPLLVPLVSVQMHERASRPGGVCPGGQVS